MTRVLFTYQNYGEGGEIEVGFSDKLMAADGVQGKGVIHLKRSLTNVANATGQHPM